MGNLLRSQLCQRIDPISCPRHSAKQDAGSRCSTKVMPITHHHPAYLGSSAHSLPTYLKVSNLPLLSLLAAPLVETLKSELSEA